jgi:polysaccharide biosynthesis protein PelF
MTTEGTYPYFKGGVSTWCHQLVTHMPDVDFHLFAVVPSPKQPLSFKLPANVASCRPFPLWGTELPGAQEAVFSKTYARRVRTTEAVISQRFSPHFTVIVRSFLETNSPPDRLAHALVALQDYFTEYDYAATLTSPEAWTIFLQSCARWLPRPERPNLEEATICMRWLLRYLSVVAVPYPEVDVVHASMAGLAGVPGTLSKVRHGTSFLLTEHGIYLRELYLALSRSESSYRCRKFLHSLNGALVRMNYHYADLVTSLGEFNRKWQIRIGAEPSKILFVPNGVDPQIFQPRPEKRPARTTVVTLARIYPLKGIEILIRAAAAVAERLPDIRFLILGEVADQEYYERCRAIVAEHHLENVVEWGETSKAHEAYNAAHVFVLSSISEGMPYGVLEAMLSGCPIVATDVGNVSDVLSGTGVVVKPKDHEDLARGLLSVLDGPDAEMHRERLAQRALERAHQEYTIEKCVTRFRGLYEALKPCAATFQTA